MLYADTSKDALKQWLQARGDKLFPDATEFGAVEMKPFLPYTSMFRRMPDARYVITLVGTALVDAFGEDATGREVKSVYPDSEHDFLHAFYAFMFEQHALSQSLRSYRRKSGIDMLIEQFMMPVANRDGVHDRYMLVTNEMPADDTELVARNRDLMIGPLVRRTVYDPRTLLPMACDFTTDREPDQMQQPLLELPERPAAAE